MTRSETPTLHCDGDDGWCGNWDVDDYENGASSVNDVRVTKDQRAPGWRCTDDEDLCPEHAAEGETDHE